MLGKTHPWLTITTILIKTLNTQLNEKMATFTPHGNFFFKFTGESILIFYNIKILRIPSFQKIWWGRFVEGTSDTKWRMKFKIFCCNIFSNQNNIPFKQGIYCQVTYFLLVHSTDLDWRLFPLLITLVHR